MAIQHFLRSGQRTCHDEAGLEVPCAGSGQDAAWRIGVAWPEPRFAVQDNVVTDLLTDLTWCRHANLAEFPLSWPEALAFVAGMNRDQCFGHSDWRMPNRRELRSLLSLQTKRPALPESHPFAQVFNGWYWTSTTAAISPAHAWYVALDGARMFYGGKDQSFMLWPVRGLGGRVIPRTGQRLCYDAAGKPIACIGSGQDGELQMGVPWPEPRFETRGELVLDRLTNLLWARNANLTPLPVTWREALAAVTELNLSDPLNTWRLPNLNELESLVDCATHSPALSSGHPFSLVQDIYWSSSTSLFEPDWAWALYMGKGATGVGQKRFAQFSVWAVADSIE